MQPVKQVVENTLDKGGHQRGYIKAKRKIKNRMGASTFSKMPINLMSYILFPTWALHRHFRKDMFSLVYLFSRSLGLTNSKK